MGDECINYTGPCQGVGHALSSLIRNVPGLTSIEVSPFWPSETARVFFLAAAGCRGGGKVGILLLDFHFSTARPVWILAFAFLSDQPSPPPELWECGSGLRTQGVVERGEILSLDFHAFHHSGISTALYYASWALLTCICW